MQEENPMYVKIDMPISLRKEILKTALKSTSLLKDFEKLKEIIQKKKESIAKLRSIIVDVKKTEKEFVKLLPELPEEIEKKKLEVKTKTKSEAKKEAKKEKPKKEKEKKEKTIIEEDPLARELRLIEEKLKALS